MRIPYNRLTGFFRSLDSIGWALLYVAWGTLAVFAFIALMMFGGVVNQILFIVDLGMMLFCSVMFRIRILFDREMYGLLLAMRRERGSGLER